MTPAVPKGTLAPVLDAAPSLPPLAASRFCEARLSSSLMPDPPPIPVRAVFRSPEVRLIHAMIIDAANQCAKLAKHERAASRGIALYRGNKNWTRNTTATALESAEMRRWLTSDSHELHSLGWCCDVVEAASGVTVDRSATAAKLLAILDGKAPATKTRRSASSIATSTPERRRAQVVPLVRA